MSFGTTQLEGSVNGRKKTEKNSGTGSDGLVFSSEA
jgi:hypothetical protein